MAAVVAGACSSYEPGPLKEFFSAAFGRLNFSLSPCKVLLKPNLLSGRSPEKAVTTHPVFVQALAEIFLDRGCTVFVGDSPGYESTERALEKSRIMEVVKSLGLGVAPFTKRVIKASSGISPYREFVFGEDPADFDLVVNVPKLKTHMMMGITAGVKNTFGFVPSLDKARWHLRCGIDKGLFAALLSDIHAVVNPGLTVLDAVAAMDGDGPSHGRVRHLGLVAMADNGFCLDAFLERALSLPFPLPISVLAREKGLIPEATLIDLGAPEVRDFRMPATMEVDFNLPSLVRETARRLFTKKPKAQGRKCTACGTCVKVCTAGALRLGEKGPSFDYGKCIRCYCCHEMCPAGAISV